jgi:TolA-binding protein
MSQKRIASAVTFVLAAVALCGMANMATPSVAAELSQLEMRVAANEGAQGAIKSPTLPPEKPLQEEINKLKQTVETLHSELNKTRDELGTLTKEVKTLDSRMKKLEGLESKTAAAESKIAARTDFHCKGNVSVNGKGVKQNCSPYICRPLDGLCGQHGELTCSSVSDCANPFVCNAGGQCIRYP